MIAPANRVALAQCCATTRRVRPGKTVGPARWVAGIKWIGEVDCILEPHHSALTFELSRRAKAKREYGKQ